MTNENNHGGARKGAGRKKGIPNTKPNKTKEELTEKHSIYLTKEQWEIFQQQGGGKTLRKMIDNGTFKKVD